MNHSWQHFNDSPAVRCFAIIERGIKRLGITQEMLAMDMGAPARRTKARVVREDAEIDRLCALVVQEWRETEPEARSIHRWCRKYDLNYKRVKAALVAAGEIPLVDLSNVALSPTECRRVLFAWRAQPVKRLGLLANRFGRSETAIAKVLMAAGVYKPRAKPRRAGA
jgi:hypothetical protein